MNRILSIIKHKYKSDKKVKEFVRFFIVGGICTIIDASIFYTVRLFAPYQMALISGYCLSLIVNYFLTVYWTFQQKANAKNAFGVIGAHMFNLFVVRFGLMFFFINLLGISEQVAYLPTFAISTITNFIIVRFAVTKLQ